MKDGMRTFLTLLILLPLIRCRYSLKTVIRSNIPGIIGNGDRGPALDAQILSPEGMWADSLRKETLNFNNSSPICPEVTPKRINPRGIIGVQKILRLEAVTLTVL